jgi:hypothetical protein
VSLSEDLSLVLAKPVERQRRCAGLVLPRLRASSVNSNDTR